MATISANDFAVENVIRYEADDYLGNPGAYERASKWLTSLPERNPARVATVAMANKTARIVWAMMSKGTDYVPELAVA